MELWEAADSRYLHHSVVERNRAACQQLALSSLRSKHPVKLSITHIFDCAEVNAELDVGKLR